MGCKSCAQAAAYNRKKYASFRKARKVNPAPKVAPKVAPVVSSAPAPKPKVKPTPRSVALAQQAARRKKLLAEHKARLKK